MADESSLSDNGKGSWWRNKLVGVLITGLTAILLIVVTPLGEWIRELVFPTSALVRGVIKEEDRPLANVKVVLDDKSVDTTDQFGRFFFQNVSSGLHSYKVLKEDNPLLDNARFYVIKRDKSVDLPDIQLNVVKPVGKSLTEEEKRKTNPAFVVEQRQPGYHVDLMHEATLIPPEEQPRGFESNTRKIAVWVQATDQILSRIERVTYYLHPTFNPSVVTRYSPDDNFALSFTAWGQFELKAKIYFKDGQVKDLSRYLSF